MSRPRRDATPVGLRLSPPVALALKLRAARENRTLSNVADEILRRELGVRADG